MNVEVIPVGLYEANCVVVYERADAAWLFDPGADGEAIVNFLRERAITPKAIIFTHAHFDHIGAVNDVLQAFPGIPVYLNAKDETMAFSQLNQAMGYPATTRPSTLDTSKRGGDVLELGGLRAEFIETPGHTPGSWCILFADEKLMISGDTLFRCSCGRTDFPGGSWRDMAASLKKLCALPEDIRVICGHGPETSIGAERSDNPYMRG